MQGKVRAAGPLLIAALLVVCLLGAPPPATAEATTLSFSALAVNPTAATQPTVRGKMIQDMAVKNGLLYTGYGDYNANTGPISISAMNLSTMAFSSFLSTPTEEINVFREIGGKLYAPQIDPRGIAWNANVGYATDATGAWATRNITPFIHVFDVASSNGSDLWLAGSTSDPAGAKGDGATLKRSTDGGATWTVAKRTTSSPTPNDFDRNYWVASAGGKVYAKPAIITPAAGTASTVDVWQNGTWSSIADPSLRIEASAPANGVVSFAGRVIMPSGAYIDSATDTIGTASTGVGRVKDFFIDGSTLYALGATGLAKTQNGTAWVTIPGALPSAWSAASLAVAQGKVYLGGADAKIYVSDLPGQVSPSPTPTPTPTPDGFTEFAVNPAAAAQPTTYGQGIKDLALADGQLYSGYGDYNTDTGPIQINPLSLSTMTFSTALVTPSEQLDVFRQINGKLYAPQIDPRGLAWNADVGYATNASGSWQTNNATPFIMVFDVASSGSDLWLAGSIADATGKVGDGAALKRSTDGGLTWTVAKRTTSSPAPNAFDRNYWIGSAGGKIYAKAALISPGPGSTVPTTVDVWQNGTWSTLADPQNQIPAAASAKQVVTLGTRVVFPNGAYIDSATNTIGQGTTGIGPVLDFAVDGATLYALSASGIAKSTDGITWTPVNIALPGNAGIACLAVGQGRIYLGGAGGKIFSATLPS